MHSDKALEFYAAPAGLLTPTVREGATFEVGVQLHYQPWRVRS